MEEKEISSEESLRLINRVIYEAKGYFYESGNTSLIYGFSIVICSLLAYMQNKQVIHLPFFSFCFLIPVFFIQAWVQVREEKKKKAKTFTDEAIDYVWTGYFLSVFASLCGTFVSAGYLIVTIILFLTGFATFLTGAISKFKYDVVAGVIVLLIAAVSFFIQSPAIYLLLAITSLMVWIIPGFILRVHFKKQHYDG